MFKKQLRILQQKLWAFRLWAYDFFSFIETIGLGFLQAHNVTVVHAPAHWPGCAAWAVPGYAKSRHTHVSTMLRV